MRLVIIFLLFSLSASSQKGALLMVKVSRNGAGNVPAASGGGGGSIDWTGKNVVFLGDSWPYGYGLSSRLTERWPAKLVAQTGGTEVNNAVSATVLQTGLCRTILDKAGVPTYTSSYGAIFIAIGLNDLGVNNASSSASNYQTALQVLLDTIAARSWPDSLVYVIPPGWVPQSARNLYIGSCSVTTARTESEHEEFVTAAASAASAKGVNYIDVYNAIKSDANKLTYLISGDPLHYNATGHLVFANYIFSQL